jgi:carboxyl-terminal processing protease
MVERSSSESGTNQTTAATPVRRQRLAVGLRIVGWTALVGVVLFCALIAVSVLYVRDKNRRAQQVFAMLQSPERQLAIYEAFWDQFSEHYFDQRSADFDWKTVRREWREKAAAATSDLDLYDSVFFQVANRFPSSHVGIVPPPSLLASDATGDSGAKDPNVLFSRDLGEIMQSDLGFEPVSVQRGNARYWLIGDVSMGSLAEKAGIEPGSIILNSNLTSFGSKAVHYSAELFKPESFEQKVALERHFDLTQAQASKDMEQYVAAHKVTVSFDVAAPLPPRLQPLIQLLDGGALYIRFDTFKDPVILDKVLTAIGTADNHGLILDLRGNKGGYQPQERRLLNRLLPVRSILGYETCSSHTELQRVSIFGRHYEGPLIVLVGPRSSSAAEIVADAVKINHRGLLIGRITNGSVLTSRTYPLPDGGGAQIPVCDFSGPDKKRIEGVGVEPDVEIIPTLDDIRAGHDSVLERAQGELRKAVAIAAQ